MSPLPRWLVQLFAVTQKEIQHIIRDKRMIAILLIAPIIQLGAFGFAVDFDVDRVKTVVVDHDHTEFSRQHLRQLFADGTLLMVGEEPNITGAEKRLDDGEVAAILIVPRGFSRAFEEGSGAALQIIVDGTDPNRGTVAEAVAARYLHRETRNSLVSYTNQQVKSARVAPVFDAIATPIAPQTTPNVSLIPKVAYNPRLSTAIYMVPGIISLLLLIVTVIITAMGLARERETGTLEQVMVTPMPPLILMTGKLLPYVIIGLFDFLLGITVASWLFAVPLRGSLWVVILGTTAYLFCTLGIGLLISTLSRTQQQAFIGGFIFMLPAILLSGVMTPLWGVPAVLLPITRLNPVRYYVEIVRGVLLRGSALNDVTSNILLLTLMGILVLVFASRRFQRSLS